MKVFFTNPDVARAQNSRSCAWPIELSPEGFGNMLAPDNVARYWVMPFEKQYETMTIKGTYPNARYFSFVAYDTDNDKFPIDVAGGLALHDAKIAPDPGSINPFVKPGGSNGAYTVAISRTGQTSGNTIKVSSDFAWLLVRVYVPDADPSLSGQSLMGGVPLPTLFVTEHGASRKLEPCSPVNKLTDVAAFNQTFFPPGVDLIGDEGTPSSDRLWFAPPTVPPIILLPNPDNKYIGMLPGKKYQPGRIIVIHGKAPGFPNTFDGSPIWVPSRGFRTVDMRYWSVCNYDLAFPVPVVNCTADLTTDLNGGYYTIVISDDLLRPGWLRRNINWLPWGDEQYPKLVVFRNMLPAPDFPFAVQNAIAAGCTFDFTLPKIPDSDDTETAGRCAQQVMGDYYPVAAWCDKSTFVRGGWRACLKEQ
jgi:hypothetical protein